MQKLLTWNFYGVLYPNILPLCYHTMKIEVEMHILHNLRPNYAQKLQKPRFKPHIPNEPEHALSILIESISENVKILQ